MRKTLLWIIKAAIAGICAIVLLSAFCLVYSYEGVHITEETGATDYAWESNQWKTTMKEGFSWLRMDENGYNNSFNYAETPDILLMGSSHMEALQVAGDENTGYFLNEMIPNYKTYNIGVSGHTIYRCVDNLDDALDTYNPQKYVVLVADTVSLETYNLKEVVEGNAKPIPSYDSGIMYYTQKIPAVKTIYKQISDWISIDYGNGNEPDIAYADDELVVEEEYEKYLNLFLAKADSEAEDNGNQLIIVYQPPQSLNADGEVVFHTDKNMLQLFEQSCTTQGIEFYDMTDDFSNLYERENKLAHGFVNSALGEGHLNMYGHREIAEAIANIVKELEGK